MTPNDPSVKGLAWWFSWEVMATLRGRASRKVNLGDKHLEGTVGLQNLPLPFALWLLEEDFIHHDRPPCYRPKAKSLITD